jgi:limonene-1,2-epoxide hydrolase
LTAQRKKTFHREAERFLDSLRRAAIRAELERQYGRYKDLTCKILNIVSNDRLVVTERKDTCTMLAGPAGDLPAGKMVEVAVVGIFEVNEAGLISAWREYWDMADIQRQWAAPMETAAR